VGIDVEHVDREVEPLEIGYHGRPDGYQVRDIDMGSGVMASLALARPDLRVTVYDFGALKVPNQRLSLNVLLHEESSYAG
jgi:hypothetical protein